MDSSRQWSGLLTSLLLVCVAGPLFGQGPTGDIAGEIYDRTGAPVSGGQLILTNSVTEATRATTASSFGAYQFEQLSPSAYDLSIDASGFRHTVERNIVVTAGAAVRLDVTLDLGDVKETIEVGGSAVVNWSRTGSRSVPLWTCAPPEPSVRGSPIPEFGPHRPGHNSRCTRKWRCWNIRRDFFCGWHAQPIKQL